jgi:hypothetical protein
MAEKGPSLKDLAISISENATIIEDFLLANGRPNLSFAATGDQTLPTGPEYEHVQDARITLIGNAKLLLDLALGPIDGMRNLSLLVCLSRNFPESRKNHSSISCFTCQNLADLTDAMNMASLGFYRTYMTSELYPSYIDTTSRVWWLWKVRRQSETFPKQQG